MLNYGTGRRRRVGRPRLRRRRGGNIFSDIHNFIKRNKVISRVGSVLGAIGVPGASAVSGISGALGYGRKRRVRRRRGGDLKSTLSSIHKFVKEKRLLSSAARHFLPSSNLHKGLHAIGYGRRRRVRRRRRGGDLKSTLSSIHKFVKEKRLLSSAARHFLPSSNLHKGLHAIGYGRRRGVRRRRGYGGANYFSTSQIAMPKF